MNRSLVTLVFALGKHGGHPRAPARWLRLLGIGSLVFGLIGSSSRAAGDGSFQGIARSRIRLVIDRGYNLEADVPELIDRMQRDYPDSLVPEFIRVVREYWLQNYAEVDARLTAAFERDSLALIDKTQKQFRERPDDPDTACLAALSQLAVGLYSVEQRRWWTAFWKVRAGRNAMLRILADDPGYADAKMAAGLADCYLDRTPGYLKPLTLLLGASGDMQRGLQRLREARDHGIITAVDAEYYLGAVQAELLQDAAGARDAFAPLAARFPANGFYQRLLGYFETKSGRREEGRSRLARIPEMAAVQTYPALGVRAEMWLCWDCMSTKDYTDALRASERAAALLDGRAGLAALRPETLIGQGEALKALGRYEEAFARFEAVSPDYPQSHRHALDRVRDIKREIGWQG